MTEDTPAQTGNGKQHWFEAYQEWLCTRPDLANVDPIKRLEIYIEEFPERADAERV